jgi:cytochrome bd ubiquinol oxidase subunit II
MHGAIYLLMKTAGDLHDQIRRWVRPAIVFFVLAFALTTMATLLYVPHLSARVRDNPALFIIAALPVLAVANIPREVVAGRDGRAFLSSCATIVGLMVLFGIEMYPYLVIGNPGFANSLTAYNAASSDTTLRIMLIIACIGVPLVLAYTTSIYWLFRGKVTLDGSSY